MKIAVLICSILLCLWSRTVFGAAVSPGGEINNVCSTLVSFELRNEIASYQLVVDQIIAAVVNGPYSGSTWNSLAEFTDKFGSRMSGSQSLENSIDYMVDKLTEIGLVNVHTENATVPHWERGEEKLTMLSPRKQILQISGSGSSIATPPGGITADIVAVRTYEEFDALPIENVQGKIVVFVPKWLGYQKTATYRWRAASLAAKKGAVATLVRSITSLSIGSLHTGGQSYKDGVNKIPTASITVEDAEMLWRMHHRGEKVTLHIEMDDHNLGDFVSRNTIAELRGQQSQPVVVLSGHLDSWDLGVGAADDGGGSFISWKALELLKLLNVKQPRRTMRVILWTGEEQGIRGALAYKEQHLANELNEFNFFMESDFGTFEPLGLDFSGNKEAECIFKEVLKLMAPLNATKFSSPIDAGPDIGVWAKRGFPSASLINKDEKYLYFHHSAGDSMLVEDPVALDKNTALFAAAAYVIADLSVDMPKNVTSTVSSITKNGR